jgi:hypothetical protein
MYIERRNRIKMGIEPTIWGSNMWAMIHLICIYAPETIDANVRNTYYMFFSMMPYVLPCEKCRDHWLEHISKYPIEQSLDTREDLFKWSVNMHNLVNVSIGKPEISYSRAFEHWTNVSNGATPITKHISNNKEYINILSKKTTNNYNVRSLIIILLILAIIMIIFATFWYMNRS